MVRRPGRSNLLEVGEMAMDRGTSRGYRDEVLPGYAISADTAPMSFQVVQPQTLPRIPPCGVQEVSRDHPRDSARAEDCSMKTTSMTARSKFLGRVERFRRARRSDFFVRSSSWVSCQVETRDFARAVASFL